jgi:IPT/TIG domain
VSPRAAAVGTIVTVTGEGFIAGATSVAFGGVRAADVTVTSPAQLTARVPPQAIAGVNMSVATLGGTSATRAADDFSYVPIAAAASVTLGLTGAYLLTAADRRVFGYGVAPSPLAALPTGTAVVGVAADAATGGYWLVTPAGAVYAYNAPLLGSEAGAELASPVVGIAADPATGGYWLATAEGRVYAFDAPNYGSQPNPSPSAPVVGITADPATGGYWLVTSKGNVINFHAAWHGSAAISVRGAHIVGMAADPATGGYWLAATRGGVYNYGAPWYGSTRARRGLTPTVAVTATATGYLVVSAAGNVAAFHTPWYGSPAVQH